MIDRLLAALGATGLELTAEEVAEVLWLVPYLGPSQRRGRTPAGPDEQPARDRGGAPAGPAPVRDRPGASGTADEPLPEQVASGMYLPPVHAAPGQTPGTAVRSPTIPALSSTLDISRALRPLRRRVPSKWETSLQEESTAQASAEARSWYPVYEAAPDRWLELALVIDEASSMTVWRRTIAEFRGLLTRIGAFRDVRAWHVDTDLLTTDGPVLRGDSAGSPAASRSPRELVDPTGRRVILVVSDCVGGAWRNGTVLRWLDLWGRSGPVAIVQPLPQRLWGRCSVDFARVHLSADRPGLPNSELDVAGLDGKLDAAYRGVAVPVLEPEARWFAPWAALVAGAAPGGAWGVALFTGSEPRLPPVMGDEDTVADDPVHRVQRFRTIASPAAFHLARYLAAAPLSLPVMRLVQSLLMPDSRPRDLAEVFLADLMCRVTPADAQVHPEQVRYDFRPGVREVLLSTLDRRTELRILSRVSDFVRSRLGGTLDFPALVAGLGAAEISEADRPFAKVAHTVLRSIGGRYGAIADMLAGSLDPATSNEPGRGAQIRAAVATSAGSALRAADSTLLHTTRIPGDVVTDTTPSPATASQAQDLPAAQPAVWGDVPPRNPNFTGRAELMETLRDQLTGSLTALLPHTLHGLGGVGKTQLAIEYVWRFASAYDLVWWISAEQPALIRSSLASLASRLGLPAGEDVDKTLVAVHDALRTHHPYKRWLLVFDNADRPEDLDRFLSTPGGHVLITSRNRTWSDVAETVEVDVFTREESVELICRRLSGASAEEADQLAEKVGDLPLALEQAASWMLATATPVADYLRLLDERVGQLLLESPPANYPLPVVATWGLAFDQLSRQAPAAVQLLELCSFFGPEPVSVRLLPMGRYASLPSPLDGIVRDEIPLRRAVRDIGRYGLAKVDPSRNSIQIHRLVQAVLRDRLSDEQRAAYRRSVHELLAAANPGDPTEDLQSWPRHADLAPHVLPAGLIESDALESHKVVLDQVRYLWVRGDFYSSRDLAERAYNDWLERLGPDYEQTLVIGRFLANALRSVGRHGEARALNEDVLARCRRTLGENHEHTLAVANSVGADLRWQGQWRQAYEHDEDTLRRHVQVFGEDDPNTLNAANNLAVDLRLLCDFERARDLDEDTVARRRRVIGEDHPLTLYGINSLSRDCYGFGDFQTALALQRQSLPQHRGKLGPDHSDVIQATRVHVMTLRSLGEYDESCGIAEDMVARSRRVLGGDHPVTLGAMTAFSCSLAMVNRLAEARVVGEDALASYRNVLGEDNPFTLAAATNLAIVLRAVGDYTAARALDEAALAGFTAALGSDHPYTLSCALNMAVNLALAREHTEARQLGERTLAGLRRMSGSSHPDTLTCASNLAIDIRATGDTETARQLAEESVTGMRKVLGPNHPDTTLAETGRHNVLPVEPATP